MPRLSHHERRLRAKQREAAGEIRVTWRKVSDLTGGGWSGLGPNGALLFVRMPRSPRWDGAKYEYGRIDGKIRVVCGGARTIDGAKRAAVELLREDPAA